jgi:SAM-dependent methyltransferase
LSKTEPEIRGMNLLAPSLRDFTYLDCKRRCDLIRREAATLNGGSRILLDLGGRGKPYAPLFQGKVAHHLVMDIEPGPSVDLVGDARKIPIADQSIDVVLCTQVIEHIPDPQAVVQEIHRILRPGGSLILSVPSIFPQHGSPGDYWRYMPQGLEWLLQDFQTVKVEGESGSVGGFFLTLNMFVYIFTGRWPWARSLAGWLFCPITNLLGGLAIKGYRGDQFASNYFAVAVR